MPDANPILNNPYEEPLLHYATNAEGELDYENIQPGRRFFTGRVAAMPVTVGPQKEFSAISEDLARAYGPLLVNLIRREVGAWRAASYPNVTRVTADLLRFWFQNPERHATARLFFAQREAIETAIWLNEVAEKSNPGTHILGELAKARLTISSDPADQLPRIAFKMATGTGKTVVMAALILYHFFNRQEYAHDTRYVDNFLVVAPGVTIKDRLAVLRVETNRDALEADYYTQRTLVPRHLLPRLPQLNAKLASDFGLIDAIESGLVKIPYLPTRDDTQSLDLPVLRDLYRHVKDDLPKAGITRQRKRARDAGEELTEAPPKIPQLVQQVLDQFYQHYEEEYKNRAHTAGARGDTQLSLDDTPPVFIVVCNNTGVSREVYKYLAGYEFSDASGENHIVAGRYDLFSNFDLHSRAAKSKPPTLIIDSDALENSGQIDESFRKIFAPEIAQFRREYAIRHGQGAAELEGEAALNDLRNRVLEHAGLV